MIDDKKIENAASEYGEGIGFGAFIDGAEWMQKEFLKDLWHPVSERPRRNTPYLVQIRDCIFETFYDSTEWKIFVKDCNITRWLYIDDLLPKEGGNHD